MAFQLLRAGTVTGRVVDAETGRGVPEIGVQLAADRLGLKASIRYERGGTSTTLYRFTSRADGTFRVLGLSPGYEYQVAVQGKSKSDFSDRLQVSNRPFELTGPRPERKVLKVSDELLAEVHELASYTTSTPTKLLPMDQATWLRNWSPPSPQASQDQKLTLLYFVSSQHHLQQLEPVQAIYGDAVRLVAVFPATTLADELVQHIPPQLDCALLIDNAQTELHRSYRLGQTTFLPD